MTPAAAQILHSAMRAYHARHPDEPYDWQVIAEMVAEFASRPAARRSTSAGHSVSPDAGATPATGPAPQGVGLPLLVPDVEPVQDLDCSSQ